MNLATVLAFLAVLAAGNCDFCDGSLVRSHAGGASVELAVGDAPAAN